MKVENLRPRGAAWMLRLHEKGGTLEHAQAMAAHESPRTTKLYDRTKERLTQDKVKRKALIAFSVGIGHIGGSKVSHYGSSSL